MYSNKLLKFQVKINNIFKLHKLNKIVNLTLSI